ncbi:MAG TPA: phosphatidylserine decarboxylase [Pyrinomonadaceae bacterium]|jgi:phosphatidylserine decarboxylase
MLAREGIPFILVPLIVAVGFALFWLWAPAVFFVLVAAFMGFFFRDPRRVPPTDPDLIVSAADGTVTRIEQNDAGKFVSVFLSPLNVHINRAPITGRITGVEYIRGKKLPATKNEASFVNERNSLTIENDRMTVVCTQIAGILARRIVCRAKAGDNLTVGEKFGLIKFSSRTDVLMPPEATLAVKIGDKVKGGETILGRIAPSDVGSE